MSIIPLHLQRKFEQRWVARFVRPVASATPKSIGLKDTINSLSRKATRVAAGDRRSHFPAPTKPACNQDFRSNGHDQKIAAGTYRN